MAQWVGGSSILSAGREDLVAFPLALEGRLLRACPPAYLLSLGHVRVALGTDGAGRLGGLEGRAVHLQPPQVAAPEAALVHDARLRCPPTAGAVPCGLVCKASAERPGVRVAAGTLPARPGPCASHPARSHPPTSTLFPPHVLSRLRSSIVDARSWPFLGLVGRPPTILTERE